ncbi:UvrB/UvrC motif-containing protein, partial [Selenomonadales bacterium OttesenSCG-928-I06]|nr:UvrB/UvrC motif-containing protein [Selenomonadales bacterium OttesenSCG-928-I06]
NPACLHITRIEGTNQIILHLCEECAAKSQNIILPEKISNLFDSKISIHDFFNSITTKPSQTLRCPKCDMSYADFTKTGRIGCSDCYNTFLQELEPLIKRVHKTIHHTGKIPQSVQESILSNELLKNLKIKLEHLVKEERYEEAAKIRDEIRSLQAKIESDKEATTNKISQDDGEGNIHDKQ